MAISFVAAGTVVTGANPTVTLPTGYAQGDLLVIITTGTATPTTPSGWTSRGAQGATGFVTILYKFATGSEASVAVTLAGTTSKAVMLAYRGVSATDTISTFSTTAATTLATTTQTTTYANEYVVSVYGSNGGGAATTWTAPASTTSRVNSGSTSTIAGLLVVDEAKATAGVTTARTATISASRTLSAVAFSIIPSNRYWVGGSGTWDTTSTTNWSDSSGGTGGAAVPTARDNVTFDQAGTYTVTCTGALACNDITVSAGTVTFAQGTTPTFAISGSMSLLAGTVWSATGGITFNATTTGKTITTNGVTLGGAVTFNGVGGAWTLGTAFTSSGSITCTAGTFSTSASNYAVTATSTTVNGGTLTLNGSTVALTGSFTYTSGTINAGTSQINLSGTASTFAGGGATYYNVSFTSTALASPSVTGANTFNNLTIAGRATSNLINFTFSADQTINGTFTLSAGTDATCRTFIKSDTFGTTRTLTCAAFSATDGDFQDITIAGAAAPASGTRLGDCKGNSGITFPAAKTVYWNLAGAQNWSATGWATTSTGTPAANNFPLAQDTATFTDAGSVTGTISINTAWNIGTVDMSGRTSAMTLSNGQLPIIYGNWTNGTGTTLFAAGAFYFSGRGAQSITSAGKTFTQNITINSPSGTITLQDALTTNITTSRGLDLTNGTLDLNGKTLTLASGASVFTSTGTKNLTFNGGTLVCSGTTSAFNNNAPTGFTTTAGTGTGTISMTAATAKTFAGGGSTFNCTLNQGGAGALTITGSNTFSDITNTYGSTGATTITFSNATTTTVAAFTAAGQATRLLTLNNATAGGTTAVIALTGGGTVTTPDYLNVKDLSFTPFTTDGTAPYKWYAGANSINSGNNSGILFAAATVTAYLLLSGTSWTTPANWNNSSNTIHMIGGGGGGSGSYASGNNRAGGGGGGGGGYTKLTNQTLSGATTYAIGAAGTQGAAGGNGGAGGTTSWNSGAATAGGGGAGTASTVPASTGGTGGTGATFNGGAGGAGGFGTTAGNGFGGGGGGGAGGPNGAGGAGGSGNTSATNTLTSGGGGGGNGGGSAGGNATTNYGGGGNNFGGTGGGTSGGAAGTLGGGGAGNNTLSIGGNGGSGIDISNTVGGAGGKGGSSATLSTANAGLYGGGGAGGGVTTAGGTNAGGAGSQGMIFIIYSPGVTTTFGDFFFMF